MSSSNAEVKVIYLCTNSAQHFPSKHKRSICWAANSGENIMMLDTGHSKFVKTIDGKWFQNFLFKLLAVKINKGRNHLYIIISLLTQIIKIKDKIQNTPGYFSDSRWPSKKILFFWPYFCHLTIIFWGGNLWWEVQHSVTVLVWTFFKNSN